MMDKYPTKLEPGKISDCCGADVLDEYGKTYRCTKCKHRCRAMDKGEKE